MSLEDEFKIADKKIDLIIRKYKIDTENWEYLNMFDRRDAKKIIKKVENIIHQTLEIIFTDYIAIFRNPKKLINIFLDKKKKQILEEIAIEETIPENGGEYIDVFGRCKEISEEDLDNQYKKELQQFEDFIDIQKMRTNNYICRKRVKILKLAIPIIISMISLGVSIYALNPINDIKKVEIVKMGE